MLSPGIFLAVSWLSQIASHDLFSPNDPHDATMDGRQGEAS